MKLSIPAVTVVLGLVSNVVWAASDDPKLKACLSSDPFFNPNETYEYCTDAMALKGLVAETESQIYYLRGQALDTTKRFIEARSDNDKALALNKNNIKSIELSGWIEINTGNLEGAHKIFSDLLAEHPDRAGCLWGMAYIYSRVGRTDLSIMANEEALKIDPDFHVVRYNLALNYVQTGLYEKAVTEYNTILKNSPDELKRVFFGGGNVSLGKAGLRETALMNKAELLKELHRYDDDLAALNEVIQSAPNEPTPYVERAKVWSLKGANGLALEDIARAKSVDKRACNCWIDLELGILYEQKSFDEVIEAANAYEQVALQTQTRGAIHFYRGLAYDALGKNRKAITDYDVAIGLDLYYLAPLGQRAQQFGYIGANDWTKYTPELRHAIEACVADPEC